MKESIRMKFVTVALLIVGLISGGTFAGEGTLDPVPFHQVKMTDAFWKPKVDTLVKSTLPHSFRSTQPAVDRLVTSTAYLKTGTGKKPRAHRFLSSDLFKVMEGAALMLQTTPSAAVEKKMDAIIDIIAKAQDEDGYLYVSLQTKSPGRLMGKTSYSYVVHSHELYNMGHMYEGAVAYYQATGKDNWLKLAEKNAKHINQVMFVGGNKKYNDGKPINQAPGHQEIELGLVKLYRATGNKLYIEMAKKFLDIRGVTFKINGRGIDSSTYAQQHKPVAQQRKAVGHAVRAGYLYASMAEVDSVLGQDTYTQALESIWHDIIDKKMHITGGLGAVHGVEGFGPEYVLPNERTYNETCAAVANVFFNYRMFLKFRDAKYLDVAEISLLNNALAGVSLDGVTFFYQNPLEVKRRHRQRSGWFGCACCPGNIARLIPQTPGYLYAQTDNTIYCTLYAGNETAITLPSGKVALTQKTGYPFEGTIHLTVTPAKEQTFTLRLRIPTWAGSQFMPGQLYRYTKPSPAWSLSVNGKAITPAAATVEKGFVTITRAWNPGDTVELRLPMPVKVNTCNEKVQANVGRVALTRGPLVYCAESVDNDGMVQRFYIDPKSAAQTAKTKSFTTGPLSGVAAITVPAKERLAKGTPDATLTLVPYYAWANRGRGSMNVWIATKKELAELDPHRKRKEKFANVTASFSYRQHPAHALTIPTVPKNSGGHGQFWSSYRQPGQSQWVEIDLGKEKTIRRVAVYWMADGGGVRVPKQWHVETRSSDKGPWKKLTPYNTDSYSTLKNCYNSVQSAKPCKARYARIVMTPQNKKVGLGIHSVNIDAK